jgi:Mg2+-importing ATPase
MLSTDNVDPQDILKQTSWNFAGLRRFMVIFGLISSIFDIATFVVLYRVAAGNAAIFQTGWFMESIATQIFVLYVLRTMRVPFLQSRPSMALFINTMAMVAIAWGMPFIRFGSYFSFARMPLHLVGILAGIIVAYLLTVYFGQRILRKQLQLS